MRTVSYQSVYEGVLRRLGYTSPGDAVTHDIARTVADKISSRVKTAWEVWPFPELTLTEERAFRSVWNDTRQFLRNGEDGNPDEFYYLTDQTYYRVIGSAGGDPPMGTLPTDTTYFEPMDAPVPFVARDQVCRRAIGVVRGVYRYNPTSTDVNGANPLPFRTSERGTILGNSSTGCWQDWGGTVFVWYSLPPSRFSHIPYAVGRTYQRGDIRFDPTTGECFQALATTSAIPADTFFWRRMPFPAVLSEYAEAGAYSDYLRGSKDPVDQANSAKAEVEASGRLGHEIDLLLAQGQKFFYGGSRMWRWTGLWSPQPWGGDRVFSLTSECQDELGFIYPVVTVVPAVAWQYRPDVQSLRTTPVALNSLPTRNLLTGSIVEIIILESGNRTMMTWELVNGPADPADPNGHVAPLDYGSDNNKHWERRT